MKDYLLILVSTIRVQGDPLANRIDQWLPQTQCGQCGFAGCRPYATAIAAGQADINQCPPGGAATIQALAELLGREPKPLNLEHGAERPKRVAVIDEQHCIGCTLCIQACPVDAIIGAAKLMHTVIAQECTGCERCLPPCPVDCIRMEPAKGKISARQQADTARQRHEARLLRLEREKQEREAKLHQQKAALQASPAGGGEDAARQAAVAAAVARAKAKKAAAGTSLAAPVTVEATTAIKAVTAPVAETSD